MNGGGHGNSPVKKAAHDLIPLFICLPSPAQCLTILYLTRLASLQGVLFLGVRLGRLARSLQNQRPGLETRKAKGA
jgi:hypothetical protein